MQSVDGKQYISLCIENTETHDFRWYDLPLTCEEEDIIASESNFVADAEGMDVMTNSSVEYHIAVAEDLVDIANRYDLDTETVAELYQETEDMDDVCKRLDALIRIEFSEMHVIESMYPYIVGSGFAERYDIEQRMEDAGIPYHFDYEAYGREILFDWDVIEQRVDHLVMIPNF